MRVVTCLAAVASVLCASTSFAHHPAVIAGGGYLTGSFAFVSSGGDFIEDGDGNRLNRIDFYPSIGYFVADGLGLGGLVAFTRTSQGDESFHVLRIGPQLTYFFDTDSNALPFITGEVGARNFESNTPPFGNFNESGYGFTLGGGVMFLPSEHLGIGIGLGYAYDHFDISGFSVDANHLGTTIGLTGFLH